MRYAKKPTLKRKTHIGKRGEKMATGIFFIFFLTQIVYHRVSSCIIVYHYHAKKHRGNKTSYDVNIRCFGRLDR